MSQAGPVRTERQAELTVVSFDAPPLNLFNASAVRTFLEEGPGKARFSGR